MGKPKQRPRLSDGFANKTIPETNWTSSRSPSSADGWLKKVQSGKIVKAGKTLKKQTNMSRLTSSEILDANTPGDARTVNSSSTASGTPRCTTVVDAQSLMTSTRRQMKIQVRSKKARQSLKKEVFQKKVELIKAAEKSKKEAKARQKTVIVGDMKPIFDALPSIPSLDSELQNLINECHSGVNVKTRRKLTMKKRQQEIAQGLKYFATARSGDTLIN